MGYTWAIPYLIHHSVLSMKMWTENRKVKQRYDIVLLQFRQLGVNFVSSPEFKLKLSAAVSLESAA